MKTRKKSSVNDLTDEQFNEIMAKVSRRKDIPLIKSEQVNMRLSPTVVNMARHLAKKAGRPLTTYLAELLSEDLERLWKVAK